MKNPKPCKGINKAHGFEGCNKPSNNRKFGLCPACLWDWMLTDERGKIWREKQFIPRVEKKQKQLDKKKTQQAKINLMSPDKYRAKYVQPLINKIARLLDYGHPCIATGNYEGKMAGGHYTSVGSNRTICLNLHNIFIQSFQSNTWNGGDDKKYQDRLKDIFGQQYFDFVNGLKGHRPINLSKEELIKIKSKAQSIINKLEQFNFMRSSEDRIIARNAVNRELGIYDLEYSIYDIELKKAKIHI